MFYFAGGFVICLVFVQSFDLRADFQTAVHSNPYMISFNSATGFLVFMPSSQVQFAFESIHFLSQKKKSLGDYMAN